MKIIVFVSKTGDWLVSFVAAILATVMLLYGGYALWDTAMLYQGAFVSQNLMKYKPSVSVDEDDAGLNELLAINPDVRGWLTIDGTHVDYPIVQGEDDMEYVNKGVYGEFSLSGTVFLDSENTSDFSDCYNLLFGHHMANGAMFGDVVRFTDRTYFEKHQTGRLFYPDEEALKSLCMRAFRRMLMTGWCTGRKSESRKTCQNCLHISKKKLCSTGTSELPGRTG